MANAFILPRITYHGLGSLEKLKEIDGKTAVIVTGGNSMEKSGVLDNARKYLKENSIESSIFDSVEPDPSLETVMKGVEWIKEKQPDIIIGLGGCSAIDAAKAMWVFYEHPNTKFEDIIPPFTIKPLRRKAKFVAIPSTSGTGTEVTCVSVITDRDKGVKHPLVSYELTPDIAIVDGAICKTMPKHVTAYTGFDALSHCVEAYASIYADFYTSPLAKKSIEMIFKSLRKAYHMPDDLNARQMMHDASCLAGMAFTNALLGILHAMAHQLGGMFGIPHGCANAILMPNVIRYNSKVTNRYIYLARLLGKTTTEGFVQEIEKLRDAVEVESSIKECGISEEDWNNKIDEITTNAMNDACCGANPRKPTRENIKNIFNACYLGTRIYWD